MIYGYLITFPNAAVGSTSSEQAAVDVLTNKTWEQSCEIYAIDADRTSGRFITSVGDDTHETSTTLPRGQMLLVRMLHKEGGPDGTLPWLASNNVLFRHRIQANTKGETTDSSPRMIKIIGNDGNERDFNDMVAVITYPGPGSAEIKPVAKPLPQGHITPPETLALSPKD